MTAPPDRNTHLHLTTLQAGQVYTVRGAERVAPADLLLLQVDVDGALVTLHLTPEEALVLSTEITKAAARLHTVQIDDDGIPNGLLNTLKWLGGRHK